MTPALRPFANDTVADDTDTFSIENVESMHPRVVNIVVSADFGGQFDLCKIASQARNAESTIENSVEL
jgi:TATA-box binding protein (TBP) (component of TFIID and TFIIIB)